jgi:hypothetical protein
METPMIGDRAPRRRREPEEPGVSAIAFFSLIAASGFVVGWFVQALGT